MLRVAASAGRIATRGVRVLPRNTVSAAATAAQRLAYNTLAPTTPCAVKASTPTMAAAPADPAAVKPAGKISQVIGAVVDVQFGKFPPSFVSMRSPDLVLFAVLPVRSYAT